MKMQEAEDEITKIYAREDAIIWHMINWIHYLNPFITVLLVQKSENLANTVCTRMVNAFVGLHPNIEISLLLFSWGDAKTI